MKLLFIGGSHDGKWEDIHEDQYTISVVKPYSIIGMSPDQAVDPIKTIEYTKRSLHGNRKTFHIMVKKYIPTDEWLQKLINGYKGG